MTRSRFTTPDPALDLVFERIVDVPVERVWQAWTDPAHLVHWFTPAPWSTVSAEVDLRPGGRFATVMRSPEGQEFPNAGCYLEVIPNERLVWSNAVQPGFRPALVLATAAGSTDFAFTGIIALEALGPSKTRYTATVLHAEPEACQRHAAMGFHQGWGAALDQLVAHMTRG
jgi:uncharacterized protein YndB with AHSA1/START domain